MTVRWTIWVRRYSLGWRCFWLPLCWPVVSSGSCGAEMNWRERLDHPPLEDDSGETGFVISWTIIVIVGLAAVWLWLA